MIKIELNEKFLEALELMENSKRNVFVTGRAGTGKSTLLDYFRKKIKKNVAVLAPTGVAAVNITGTTIHSFFGFKPDITVDKVKREYKNRKKRGLYKKLDAIVIDEISMVRADLLDCVDEFLRLNGKNSKLPFGGIQMVLFGDLYQLPPVVTANERDLFTSFYKSPYFFDAKVFEGLEIEIIELEKIYRQKDADFIDILNGIRNRSVTQTHLDTLNTRFDDSFSPPPGDLYIYITTTNAKARMVNKYKLSKLSSKEFAYKGEIVGKFEKKSLPADLNLKLKVGAQIMLVNNDRQGRWINGTVGKVIGIKEKKGEDADTIIVKLLNGETVDVAPHTWEMFRFVFNTKRSIVETETIGSFTQYPIILAWAITIHKSQGKTFEKVIIDMDRGAFAHGQTYVALSRCTSLGGIVLKKPIEKRHVLLDWRVVRFLTNYQYNKSEKRMSLGEKTAFIKRAVGRKQKIGIVYLKSNDEKSKREVFPESVGQMEYKGVTYLGMEGFCCKRQETRVFRVDRILNLGEVND